MAGDVVALSLAGTSGRAGPVCSGVADVAEKSADRGATPSRTAGFLIAPLERAGVPVTGVSRQFYVDACGALDAAVTSRQVRHDGQAELAEAVSLARWSTSGEAGTRVLSRRNPRVSPLVAAALAVHGLATARRRPGRFVSF